MEGEINGGIEANLRGLQHTFSRTKTWEVDVDRQRKYDFPEHLTVMPNWARNKVEWRLKARPLEETFWGQPRDIFGLVHILLHSRGGDKYLSVG